MMHALVCPSCDREWRREGKPPGLHIHRLHCGDCTARAFFERQQLLPLSSDVGPATRSWHSNAAYGYERFDPDERFDR